jgi:heme-degrading monooxygenase HmoA
VILINPFEVPAGEEEAALRFWEEAAESMRRQPGFISTRLHKALSPEARFAYVNIAEGSRPSTSKPPSAARSSRG